MKTFVVTSFDQGGVQSTKDAIRLVCLTETNEKVAIWGSAENTKNIDKVFKTSLPCKIECECRTPNEWGRREYGHHYWVREDAKLMVIQERQGLG